MQDTPSWVQERLSSQKSIHLFLDYDGTLADFAPTPDDVFPDPALIDLIRRLAEHPRIRVAVISGRRLAHIRDLLPVEGCQLAGTYGIELLTAEGERVEPLVLDSIRPVLDELKASWEELSAGRKGIYLEDKGWSLALHARFADEATAREVVGAAQQAAARLINLEKGDGLFRQHGGPRFYEICPAVAHKGRAVEYLLEHSPWPDALPVYLGDDYNDEDAFGVVKAHGGIAVLVLKEPRQTQADFRLAGPKAARQWLADLLDLIPSQ